VAAASAAGVPEALCEQLADGGRLVVPTGSGQQRLVRLRRTPAGLEQTDHEPVRFVPLISDGPG
jgi:protein-L-isoaspartate(D-aspartate) O-methyltransferase